MSSQNITQPLIKPPILSNYHPGSLLLDFFALYGGSFNFVHTGVSITEGGRYFEKLTRVPTGSSGWYKYPQHTLSSHPLSTQTLSSHPLLAHTPSHHTPSQHIPSLTLIWTISPPSPRFDPKRIASLALESPDPNHLDTNIGSNSYNMPKIRRAFEHAHQVLTCALSVSQSHLQVKHCCP